MTTTAAARGIAAAVTATLVAILLVTTGGTSRAPGHRATTSQSEAGASAKPARAPQAVAPRQHQQSPHQLDISATPPWSAADVRDSSTFATPEPAVVRTGRGVVSPNGRAPPAL